MTGDSIYTGLISPDTYEYLDETKPEDLINDPLLEEQEEMEASDLFDEDEYVESNDSADMDDSDAYSSNLFDYVDEEDDDYEDEKEELSKETELSTQKNEEVYLDEDDEEYDENQSFVKTITTFIFDKENVFVKYFNQCSEEELQSLNDMIEKAKNAFLSDGKDKMFSIPETDMTIAVVRNRTDQLAEAQRKEFIAAQMLLEDKEAWHVLFICFKSENSIKCADYVKVSRLSFTDGEWRMVLSLAQKIKDLRK